MERRPAPARYTFVCFQPRHCVVPGVLFLVIALNVTPEHAMKDLLPSKLRSRAHLAHRKGKYKKDGRLIVLSSKVLT
jgi:hypothetical protein